MAAAKAAHADHFIRSLPHGYQTVLNEEASNISQGQKQLLTIARALLADPAVLILDEATSSVDTRTEMLIQKAMIVGLYVLILNSILELMERRKMTEELQVAKRLLYQQREHYHQILDYIEQVRIIRHDFRHHIHALLNMDRDAQARYLRDLQKELDNTAAQTFCQNQAVNGLLQEYAGRCQDNQVELDTNLDLPETIPIDDLTLCIVIGNLLENALDACRRFSGPRFIRIRCRWGSNHLELLVENSFDGQVRKIGGELLSRKQEGGLGLLSIRRTLSCPGDDFEVCYSKAAFTAMRISSMSLNQDIRRKIIPQQSCLLHPGRCPCVLWQGQSSY